MSMRIFTLIQTLTKLGGLVAQSIKLQLCPCRTSLSRRITSFTSSQTRPWTHKFVPIGFVFSVLITFTQVEIRAWKQVVPSLLIMTPRWRAIPASHFLHTWSVPNGQPKRGDPPFPVRIGGLTPRTFQNNILSLYLQLNKANARGKVLSH